MSALSKNIQDDTIVAISTPPGEGGIGIVRISGAEALNIADRIFHSPRGIKPSLSPSHRIYYGFIVDPATNQRIDEVLISVMKAPNTYTREDVVEINCHGGYVVLRKVFELVLNFGARPALPGEFTMRAFLNGRIDLTQAEAVLDLIKAKTEEAERIALEQVTGALRDEIDDISSGLQDILAELEAYIDFPEEDLNLSPVNWPERIKIFKERLRRLSSSFHQGRIMREGIATVIAGRPNVGKSSLLNALLGEDRAIVTDMPGTTRDIIEEIINIMGIPLRLIDTAGIREARDIVEAEGIRRTETAIERADLVLFVLDGSCELTPYDFAILHKLHGKKKKTIVILNKADKGIVVNREIFENLPVAVVSALKKEGIEELREMIFDHIVYGEGSGRFEPSTGLILTRARHKLLIDEAIAAIEVALSEMETSGLLEIITFNLRKAIMALNEITGLEFTEETLLDRIFSEFCIGK
ncbi:MAG: tRNA uridine-5-carboxymethylaminomethyl(34) synthesis GTPase MnmE [Thermodesulfovibrionales bacterium]|nr:tRNA uridine-5-carboxymethylaminomethyl(34) synthesis GTPase MnmE [Thermodesulfovibrionales bacterium]